MKNNDGTASLDKALDVLEAIGSSSQGLNQAELAERVLLPRTTLYRIISSLVNRGLVRRDPLNKVYRLGFRYLELVRNAYLEPDLVAAASFELRSLRDLTGETSYLAVLDGNQVLSLERCDGAHSTRSAAALGQSKPVYCTGQGKAILAAQDEASREALLKSVQLLPLTPLTLTDRRQLQAELRITAARGYAIDDEEIVMGIRCVAAAIVDSRGTVRGALSVAGPAYRLTRERLELLGPEVAAAARRVGSLLAVHDPLHSDENVVPVSPQWCFDGAFPRWSSNHHRLYWADRLAPAIQYFDGHDVRILARMDAPILAMELHRHGLLVATAQGWQVVSHDGEIGAASNWQISAPTCMCVAANGELWVALQQGGKWKVGRLDNDGSLHSHWQFNEPVEALAWNNEATELYALVPASGSIFLLQPGSTAVRRFASLPKGSGTLKGLALDQQGGVWAALKDGWSVVRLAPDGSMERLVGVPVQCPTDLAFGGEQGDTLFITSSRHSLSRDALVNAQYSGHLLKTQLQQSGAARHETTWHC